MGIIEDREKRTAWFMHDRFGMFIHWGLYSIPARGEWVRGDEELSDEHYMQYFEEWNPTDCDMKEWARVAKEAGMKYVVLTTKHHEGFCLWDSKYTDFKTTNTKCKRDFVKEYVEAFREAGLKVGFYYSLLDWQHPDYTVRGDMYHPNKNREECCAKEDERDFNRYLDYMHGQVEELMTNYGKIDLLWFDFSYEGHIGSDWRGEELLAMVRRHQPDIVINGRLEANGESYGSALSDEPTVFTGDFTCPEMIIPPYGLKTPSGRAVPWEACFTLNNNWGYAPFDLHYKTSSQIIKKLVECTSKNGNMIVNISPDAKGNIPKIQKDILAEVGQWMQKNSDSIYGCGMAEGLPKPEWGRYTQKGNKVYAHITPDEALGAIALPGLKGKVKKARRLRDGFEMRMLTPWVAKEFPDCEFMNYSIPDCFSFTVDKTPVEVIEFELKED